MTLREFLELAIATNDAQIERFLPEGLFLFPEAALRHRQVGQQVRSLP